MSRHEMRTCHGWAAGLAALPARSQTAFMQKPGRSAEIATASRASRQGRSVRGVPAPPPRSRELIARATQVDPRARGPSAPCPTVWGLSCPAPICARPRPRAGAVARTGRSPRRPCSAISVLRRQAGGGPEWKAQAPIPPRLRRGISQPKEERVEPLPARPSPPRRNPQSPRSDQGRRSVPEEQ